mmetsp:Transcript_18146/g.39072  ORF Transcript_18146/g.39072 Transcript_18146/m.39072 type:complete len:217 (-) Transcript_18146:404-1054(-)
MPQGQDQDGVRAVHAVASRHQIRARLAHVDEALVHHGFGAVPLLNDALARGIDPKNAAGRDARVEVGRAVDRVKARDVGPPRNRLQGHRLLLLLRNRDTCPPAVCHRSAEQLVGHHVQLFLLIAAGVLCVSCTHEVRDRGAVHERANLLACCRDGRHERKHVHVGASSLLLLQKPCGQGHQAVLLYCWGGMYRHPAPGGPTGLPLLEGQPGLQGWP